MGLVKLDLVFFSFFLCHLFLLLNPAYSSCQKPFRCGNFIMEFPFSDFKNPGCGLIMVDNCVSEHEHPRIVTGDSGLRYNYTILNMIPPNKLVVYDPDLQSQLNIDTCYILKNVSLSKSPSISSTISSRNLTLFTCYNQTSIEQIDKRFANYKSRRCGGATVYYRTQLPTDHFAEEISGIAREYCPMIQLPMKSNHDKDDDLFKLIEPEFTLEWNVTEDCHKCYHGGGQCLSSSTNEFQCKYKEGVATKKIFLIGGVTLAALTSTAVVMIVLVRRKYPLLKVFGFRKAKPGDEEDIELFLKRNGNLAPLRYSYSDIKKMTKSFSENLGKGGYGSVYKGKLRDGRLVAVKILKESQGNGEEFMNEVASISRTSHINIVSLFGFCFQGSKRALIYEFMPNGSLEKFIHTTSLLQWQKLFEIAVGIARGLEYLHQGCNTRILHFDIKPHNILLDKDFNPRISDFGLAKLCPNRSSIVSMLVARGTIGYIAPEVFCRNFGEVSHKSDVYSYGMMVLEIAAGGKKTVDPRDVDHSSEAYFPHYIYKQLEMDVIDMDGGHHGIVNEDESQSAKRKLTIVGLWCIQTVPRDRPSMTKVVEMLEGKLESLQVPPEPCLSSPPRSVLSFSASESI